MKRIMMALAGCVLGTFAIPAMVLGIQTMLNANPLSDAGEGLVLFFGIAMGFAGLAVGWHSENL